MEKTLLSLLALVLTGAMTLVVTALATVAFFGQLMVIGRRMQNYTTKLDLATKLLTARRFPDELIGEMARIADFDAQVVQTEMKDVMSRMNQSAVDAPDAIQLPFGPGETFKKTKDPNYHTMIGLTNDVFGEDKAKLQQHKPSDDPAYQTLVGLDNAAAFGEDKAQQNVAQPEQPMGFKAVNDPNYQTLAGLDNAVFDKNN